MKKEILDKIKKKLETEKLGLELELSKFAHRNLNSTQTDYEANFPNLGEKEDENASEVAQFSTNLSLEDALEKALRDVEKAIESIDKGNYGICKYCGQEIDERRLEARPTSGSCIKCKKTLTQEM